MLLALLSELPMSSLLPVAGADALPEASDLSESPLPLEQAVRARGSTAAAAKRPAVRRIRVLIMFSC